MEDATAVAHRWIDAWRAGDNAKLFTVLAAAAPVESNLDPDGDFIEILRSYASGLDGVEIFSLTAIGPRAAIVYDCTKSGETFRLAEFLEIGDDGLVHGVRRVYDLSAVERLMPDLLTAS
jgi:hypothetical protein